MLAPSSASNTNYECYGYEFLVLEKIVLGLVLDVAPWIKASYPSDHPVNLFLSSVGEE
jgi:hypothetical protein